MGLNQLCIACVFVSVLVSFIEAQKVSYSKAPHVDFNSRSSSPLKKLLSINGGSESSKSTALFSRRKPPPRRAPNRRGMSDPSQTSSKSKAKDTGASQHISQLHKNTAKEERENKMDQVDEQLYSRQLFVYGRTAQQRLGKAHVLLYDMTGISGTSGVSAHPLAAEVAKNLALAGVGSLTIVTHESVPSTATPLTPQSAQGSRDSRDDKDTCADMDMGGTWRLQGSAADLAAYCAEINPAVSVRRVVLPSNPRNPPEKGKINHNHNNHSSHNNENSHSNNQVEQVLGLSDIDAVLRAYVRDVTVVVAVGDTAAPDTADITDADTARDGNTSDRVGRVGVEGLAYVNDLCRTLNRDTGDKERTGTPFVGCMVRGVLGFVFNDFGENFDIEDVEGETFKQIPLASVRLCDVRSDGLANVRVQSIEEEALGVGIGDTCVLTVQEGPCCNYDMGRGSARMRQEVQTNLNVLYIAWGGRLISP